VPFFNISSPRTRSSKSAGSENAAQRENASALTRGLSVRSHHPVTAQKLGDWRRLGPAGESRRQQLWRRESNWAPTFSAAALPHAMWSGRSRQTAQHPFCGFRVECVVAADFSWIGHRRLPWTPGQWPRGILCEWMRLSASCTVGMFAHVRSRGVSSGSTAAVTCVDGKVRSGAETGLDWSAHRTTGFDPQRPFRRGNWDATHRRFRRAVAQCERGHQQL
jgi:hypothetical protein